MRKMLIVRLLGLTTAVQYNVAVNKQGSISTVVSHNSMVVSGNHTIVVLIDEGDEANVGMKSFEWVKSSHSNIMAPQGVSRDEAGSLDLGVCKS
ncbi:hypothetical protein V6N11_013805 [Hibiscus sabdariffa]|uniref:Uncharacterized protein n=1 Tax=Hibiscus sabdariffa TaxID=183260 RepID=A0ABR2PDI2_9ROSI